MEELLAKAVTIDCRKEWYCRFFSKTNVFKIEVSQVADKHSVSVARHTPAGCINQEEGGRNRHHQVRAKCWYTRPSGLKR